MGEQKKSRSEIIKSLWRNSEYRDKQVRAHTGKQHKPGQIEKMKESYKKRNPHYGEIVMVFCSFCSNKLDRQFWYVQQRKTNTFFCNRTCQSGYMIGKKLSESTKQKLRSVNYVEKVYGVNIFHEDDPKLKELRSQKTKALWQNPEYRERMRQVHKGKSPANKGKPGPKQSEETKKQKSQTMKELWADPNSIFNSAEFQYKQKHPSMEAIQKRAKALKGRLISEKHRQRLIEVNTGKKATPETIQKLKESHKFYYVEHPEVLQEMSITRKALWQDPEFVKKQMKSRGSRPNKPELKLQSILNETMPNEYKYVGDGEFILAGKCPDFMNVNGKKKLIELYGRYWHKDDNPEDRIAIFKPYGYDTLIIWEDELRDSKSLTVKMREFTTHV